MRVRVRVKVRVRARARARVRVRVRVLQPRVPIAVRLGELVESACVARPLRAREELG